MRGQNRFVPEAWAARLEGRALLTSLGQFDANFWNSNQPAGFISNTGIDTDDRRLAHPLGVGGGPTVAGPATIRSIQQFQKDFASLYASMEQAYLFPGGAAGLAVNRPAFDRQVGVGLTGVENNIIASLSGSARAALSLIPTVHQTLTGGSSTSLLSRLNALPTPTEVAGPTAKAFTAAADALINQAFAQLVNDVKRFVRNPRLDFATGTHVRPA